MKVTKALADWFAQKWRTQPQETLLSAYRVAFCTPDGQRVLQQLLDEVYCTVCQSNDPLALAAHNAQRALVQNILENLDRAEQPEKYTPANIEVESWLTKG